METHISGAWIGMADQAGIIHERRSRVRVGAEREGTFGYQGFGAVPPDIRFAVCRDTEKVMILYGKDTLSPARFDSRLCDNHHRINPESRPRLYGKGQV